MRDNKKRHILIPCITAVGLFCSLSSLTIAEKRQSLVGSEAHLARNASVSVEEINKELVEKQTELTSLSTESHAEYLDLVQKQVAQEDIEAFFKEKHVKIKKLKQEILALQATWKEAQDEEDTIEQEALWHQPDTTIGQLIIDYGSLDYIYLMPQEIASLKINLSSQLSVPRASWNEMLELILSHYGIGIKQLTPFLRQLYLIRLNQSGLFTITSDEKELAFMPDEARVCFVASPAATELRRIFTFLEKFAPQEQMFVQVIGNTLVLVGLVHEIRELLKVYNFISAPKFNQAYRLIALQKANSEEMANILLSLFEGQTQMLGGQQIRRTNDNGMSFISDDSAFGFRVIAMKHPAESLFLLGKPEQLEKACSIISDIESKITAVQEKEIHYYSCKHSEADELAEVLSLVYTKMIETPGALSPKDKRAQEVVRLLQRGLIQKGEQKGFDSSRVVSTSKVSTSSDSERKRSYAHHENFIVDNKTNSIVMVVEPFVFPKLKELLKKIDVPKKMVQIDVLLFEKRISDNNSFGLNLLRLGDAATKKKTGSLIWNKGVKKKKKKKKGENNNAEESTSGIKGLLQFILTRGSQGDIPAFDLAYNFLLSQENIQINANPSITTVNQTPCKIAVVDQISISTGVVELDTSTSTRLKDSFTREEYGIIIEVTPTVHAKTTDEEAEEGKFITLATDIVFDTTRQSTDNRPDVTRRNIKNEVRVRDGETVILGGLRRKLASESQNSIPFLGEIPGIGKLFSTTSIEDSSTEMFIFLTPRILPDQTEQFEAAKKRALEKRPGDLPEFLEEVAEAQTLEKRMLFERSFQLLFGSAQSAFKR